MKLYARNIIRRIVTLVLERKQEIQLYRNEYQRYSKEQNCNIPLLSLLRDFSVWRRFRRGRTTPLEESLPWMPYSAVRMLRRILRPGHRVFEWGMGGSTAFLLDLGVEVYSVEHDVAWMDETKRKIGNNTKWHPYVVSPEAACAIGVDPSDWTAYETSDERLSACRFRSYAKKIDEFPSEYFDLVIIDGRARPSCMMHAISRIAENGYLLLDNCERSTYQPAILHFMKQGFIRHDFHGATVCLPWFTSSSLWRRK